MPVGAWSQSEYPCDKCGTAVTIDHYDDPSAEYIWKPSDVAEIVEEARSEWGGWWCAKCTPADAKSKIESLWSEIDRQLQ